MRTKCYQFSGYLVHKKKTHSHTRRSTNLNNNNNIHSRHTKFQPQHLVSSSLLLLSHWVLRCYVLLSEPPSIGSNFVCPFESSATLMLKTHWNFHILDLKFVIFRFSISSIFTFQLTMPSFCLFRTNYTIL